MGLFWTESFESSQYATKINANGSIVNSAGGTTGGGRTGALVGYGAYSVRLGAGDQDDLVIVGAAFTPSSGTSEALLFSLYGDAGATRHVSAYITATGYGNPATIKVYRGTNAGALLATSSPFTVPLSGGWFHAEMKVRLHDSAGTVALRVDETLLINASGLDTKNAGTAAVFDTVETSGAWANGYDDVYICNEQGSVNTDFLGAVRIEALYPNGNGATSNGVGSDGNSTDNYLLVQDNGISPLGFDPATYVDLAATGDKDTYAHLDSTLPTGNSVKGVFVWAYAQKTDAGSRSLTPVARLAGTESDGDTLALINGTFKYVGDVFETKPGGGAWTVADVNSAEFGAKAGA